jgi:small-conductance mechanosensitive channel
MEVLSKYLAHPYAEVGTPVIIALAIAGYWIARKIIEHREQDYREAYRKRQIVLTLVVVSSMIIIIVLWARLLQRTGTFLGLVAGGLAIALREPLLAIAGRIAILAGRMYTVGDRIQVEQLTGDIIDIGFFYTRMMEVGNWINGDQVTGRIVQFSNSKIFGETPVYNYTRNFAYIWDELMLPVTYKSDLGEATAILLHAGNEYTKNFLQGAQEQLEEMKHYFLVPSVELKPQVYMTVTSNWVELRMRYVVEPKKRRAASNFIWEKTFEQLREQEQITIASQTSDVAIHWNNTSSPVAPNQTAQGQSRAGIEKEIIE